MAIAEYRSARTEARNRTRFLERIVNEGFIAAQRTLTGPDGLDHFENLTNANARTTFSNTLSSYIQNASVAYYQSSATSTLVKDELMDAFCGFGGNDISSFIEKKKDNISIDSYTHEFLNDTRVTKYRMAHGRKSEINPDAYFPNLAADVPTVLTTVGLAAHPHVRVPDVTAADLAELINQWDTLGVISPVWLQGQHYYH